MVGWTKDQDDGEDGRVPGAADPSLFFSFFAVRRTLMTQKANHPSDKRKGMVITRIARVWFIAHSTITQSRRRCKKKAPGGACP